MDLKQEWTVAPVDHIVEDDFGLSEPMLIKKEELFDLEQEEETEEIIKRLGPSQRVLNIMGYRWIVKPRVLITQEDAARQMIYWNIIRAFENGQIVRLGRCLRKNCQRFFVARRLGQKFCNVDCTKTADTKAARRRMKNYRKHQEEEIKAKGLPKLTKLAGLIKNSGQEIYKLMDQIPELSNLRKHLGELWDEFEPLMHEISDGRKEASIWESLPPRIKKALAEAPL